MVAHSSSWKASHLIAKQTEHKQALFPNNSINQLVDTSSSHFKQTEQQPCSLHDA